MWTVRCFAIKHGRGFIFSPLAANHRSPFCTVRDRIRNPDHPQQRASHRFMIFQRRLLNNISFLYLIPRYSPVRETIPIDIICNTSRQSSLGRERGISRVYVHGVYTRRAFEENEISDTDPRNKPTDYDFLP